ncbi:GNAT family N-acetyltransferase [Alkaliphilus serpentinus]|nr:GNAT family N-acetyltransferase [Alkaliphilus serpentinus]
MKLNEVIYLEEDKYKIKILSGEDIGDINDLCNRAEDYFLMVDKKLPDENTSMELLKDIPPSKTLEDKFLLGVYSYSDNKLIAIVDILRDFHKAGEWMIGLLLLDKEKRKIGLGRAIQSFIEEWVKEQGGSTLKIGVLEINNKAMEFWCKTGYKEYKRVNMEFGGVDEVVIAMEKRLSL